MLYIFYELRQSACMNNIFSQKGFEMGTKSALLKGANSCVVGCGVRTGRGLGDQPSREYATTDNPRSCFLPGSRDGKFSGKFGVLKFPVSLEIYFGIPGNFFTLVRVSVVLISIISTYKMCYCIFKIFFAC